MMAGVSWMIGWAPHHHRKEAGGSAREEEVEQRSARGDAALLTLKTEEGPRARGCGCL